MSETSSPTISLAPSLGDYFRDPVKGALHGREIEASPATETYLVQLLTDFAHPTQETASTLSQPATFLLHEAMSTHGPERFKRLQRLGDGVLYNLGFFGEALGDADRSYLVHVGSRAYGHASAMLRAGQASEPNDVLGELAQRFARFVDVLVWVSDWVLAQSVRGEEGLLRLYERWLRTRSSVLRDELGQRGMLALPNPGGTH